MTSIRVPLSLLVAAGRWEFGRLSRGRPTPYKLEIMTTFACQGRCRTCNIWSRYLEAPDDRLRELSADEILRFTTSVREQVGWISLTGGEATLRNDLLEIVEGIVRAYDRRLVLLSITTNGLDPMRGGAVFSEIARMTKGRTSVFVSVSLDGVGDEYDRVRGVPGGFLKVCSSMETLTRLSREHSHFTAGYQMTLSRLNAGHAVETYQFARQAPSAPTVTIATDSHQLTQGKAGICVLNDVPTVGPILDRIAKRVRLTGFEAITSRVYLELAREYLESGVAPLDCVGGEVAVTIDPYGNVLPCDVIDLPLGNLHETDFDLLRLIRGPSYREGMANVRGCRKCWTPCLAYPTILHRPMKALCSILGSRVGGHD